MSIFATLVGSQLRWRRSPNEWKSFWQAMRLPQTNGRDGRRAVRLFSVFRRARRSRPTKETTVVRLHSYYGSHLRRRQADRRYSNVTLHPVMKPAGATADSAMLVTGHFLFTITSRSLPGNVATQLPSFASRITEVISLSVPSGLKV